MIGIDPKHPVAVIGAGVIGMACARALQRAGQPVVVFDPNDPGSGCSFGNAGHIAVELVAPYPNPSVLKRLPRLLTDPLGPLALKPAGMVRMLPWMLRFLRSCSPARVEASTIALASLLHEAWPAWREEIATSKMQDLFVSRGSLTIYESLRLWNASKADVRIQAAHGVSVEEMSAADLHALVPGLQRQVAGARRYPGTSHVRDPQDVVAAMARRFVGDGGRIERAVVTGFEFVGGSVSQVRTSSVSIPTGAVVLAAGWESPALARMLGVKAPVTRERGYHAIVPAADLPVELPVTFEDRAFICTPMAMGTRLAGTVELGAGDEPDWRRAEILLTHIRQLFGKPGLAATSRWFGNRPTLPDYLPMIGSPARAANAVMALGHQHLGLTLAAITGRLVMELITGKTPSVPLAPFNTGRFGSA